MRDGAHQRNQAPVGDEDAIGQGVIRQEHDVRLRLGCPQHDVLAFARALDVARAHMKRDGCPGLETQAEPSQAVLHLHVISPVVIGAVAFIDHLRYRDHGRMGGPYDLDCPGEAGRFHDIGRDEANDHREYRNAGCGRIAPDCGVAPAQEDSMRKRFRHGYERGVLNRAFQIAEALLESRATFTARDVRLMLDGLFARRGKQQPPRLKAVHAEASLLSPNAAPLRSANQARLSRVITAPGVTFMSFAISSQLKPPRT